MKLGVFVNFFKEIVGGGAEGEGERISRLHAE